MKRLVVFVVVFSMGYAPLAFAEGPLLASARRAAQELSVTAGNDVEQGQPGADTSLRAAGVQQGSSESGGRNLKLWVGLGLLGVLVATMKSIDSNVEDNTPSSRRARQDGCTLFCN
jgi:hypothetical protein